MERRPSDARREGNDPGGAGQVAPSNIGSDFLAATVSGAEETQRGESEVTRENAQLELVQVQGDLLRNVGPVVSLDLGESRMNPEMRRVEVTEGRVETVGRMQTETLAGPPVVYGPPVAVQGRMERIQYPEHFPGVIEGNGQPGEFGNGQIPPPNLWPGSVNTPVRPPGLGMEGVGINPFWSPEVRAIGERTQLTGEVGLLARARQAVQPESPAVEMDPVELFRLRCMREAEEKFMQGLEKMKGKPHPEEFHIGSTESYRSCANMGDATPDGKPKPQGTQGRNLNADPEKHPQEVLPRNGDNRDGSLWGKRAIGETTTEALRSVDLPPLHLETSALGFGDWLTLIDPMMADVSYSSGDWWALVMNAVRNTYEEWLQKDPLGRLRIQVQRPEGIEAWPRTEKRIVNSNRSPKN